MIPREKLIEKVASIINEKETSLSWDRQHQVVKDQFLDIAEAIINYLKLEVVDNDIIHGLEYCLPEKLTINVDKL